MNAKHHIYRHEGREFHCGCKPRLHRGLFVSYKSVAATYTLAEILAAIAAGKTSLLQWVWTILDQGQYGDCWDYSELNTLMTKLNMLYGEKVLLDASMAVVLTGQYDGGGIDSAISQVFSVTGVATAEFMGTDPTKAITKRKKSLWPAGWEANAAIRTVPDGDWADSSDKLELASALIDGNPATVGVSWQGGGHALECAEAKTAAKLNAEVELAASAATIPGAKDALLRHRDRLMLPADYRDDDTGKLVHVDASVADFGSNSDLLFAGPNSWGTAFDSGWGSYPGRAGWWLLSASSSAMRETFSSNGFGACILHGAKDLALPPTPPPPQPDPSL